MKVDIPLQKHHKSVPAGVSLVGLGRLELQAFHGLKFEPHRVRTFHSWTSVTRQALSPPKWIRTIWSMKIRGNTELSQTSQKLSC